MSFMHCVGKSTDCLKKKKGILLYNYSAKKIANINRVSKKPRSIIYSV